MSKDWTSSQLPLDLVGAEKVTQLRLGREFKFIEVAKMLQSVFGF